MRKDNLKEKIIEILKEVKLGKNMNVVLLIDDYLIMKADQILELFEKEEDDTIDGLLLANEGLQMQVNALLKEQPPEEWEKEGETDIDVLYVKRAKNDANCDSFINIPKVIIRQLLQEEKKKWTEEMISWLKEMDITKPSSSILAILYRRLKSRIKNDTT